MNVRLLERVRHEIVARPERFCAAHWAWAHNKRAVLESGARPEGFTCCIAGHVLLLSGTYDEADLLREGGFHDTGYLWQRAAEAAGLSTPQRNELFFPSQWGQPFKQRYYLCTRAEEAAVSATYLEHFLAEHAPAAGRTWAPDRSPRPGALVGEGGEGSTERALASAAERAA